MIGAVAQFERSLIAERVKAGLDHARKNGVVLGRPPLRKLTGKEIIALRRQRIQRKLPYRTLAREKGTKSLPVRFAGALSPVRFEGGSWGIAAISSDSQRNAARFLCNPDCVAERAVSR